MYCPVCQVELKLTDRQGIEIDYCPKCRGIWLDRGELDKIIQRSTTFPHREDYSKKDFDEHDSNYWEHEDGKYYKRKKHKSFLEDLFDFD